MVLREHVPVKAMQGAALNGGGVAPRQITVDPVVSMVVIGL